MAEKEKVSMNYKEQVQSVSSFNSRLLEGRKTRIPFYDPSTGVYFNDGRRLYSAKERRPGLDTGQVYCYVYSSRPYKLKPRPPPPPAPVLPPGLPGMFYGHLSNFPSFFPFQIESKSLKVSFGMAIIRSRNSVFFWSIDWLIDWLIDCTCFFL